MKKIQKKLSLVIVVMICSLCISCNGKDKNTTENADSTPTITPTNIVHAKDCNEAANQYAVAVQKLITNYNQTTCKEVQAELKELYKECKTFMPEDIEEEINHLCEEQ